MVVVEAENYQVITTASSHYWQATNNVAGFAGVSAMRALPNSGLTASSTAVSPMMSYSVVLTNSGKAKIWMRCWAANGSDDSVFIGVDGVGASLSFGGTGAWLWKSTSVTIANAGAHTINVWMREDGGYVDRIILSLNSSFTPTGVGPAESAQTSGSNAPPTILLTAPATGSSYLAGTVIPVSATAADSDGYITKVDFYTNSALSASIASAPYSYNWTPAAGSYQVYAIATDSLGAMATSSVASVTVTSAPPVYSVKITSPANGASYTAGTTIPIASVVTNSGSPVIGVQYFINGGLADTETTAPYTYSWTPAAGSYQLVAVATNGLGNAATSGVVNVTITTPVSNAAFVQADGMVTVEAEHFQASTTVSGFKWQATNDVAGYVGAAAMKALPNSGTTASSTASSPMLSYLVQLTNSGSAKLWVRGWAASGSDDSIYAGLDGVGTSLSYSSKGAWMWKSVAITVPNSGAHQINIWMREDGAYVDRVILSLNSSFTPTGDGPPESAQGGGATNAPVAANFAGSPTSGLAPLAVVFTNSSTGAANYFWAFGDGNTSVLANPSYTYTNAGSYTVTLTAVGAGGTNILAKTNYIVVANTPVVANFAGTPTIGLAPLAVSFSNLSSGAASYAWDFGDGSTSTVASPAKTYTNAGTYSVTLTAVGAGGTNLFTRTNYIVATNAPPPVIADFTGVPTNGLAPLAVVFTNLSGGAASYAWDFGDGNTSTLANPTNVYTNAGSYTVILTAVGAGGTNAITFTNYIVATNALPPVVADFTGAPTIGLAPLAVSFSNLSSGAASYSWDFGDGTTSAAASPVKTYTNAGTYSVTLTAVGAGGTNVFTRTNYIVATNAPPPVIASFTGAPTNGLAPLAVVFTNLSSGAASYAWDFGDGNTSTDTNPTNVYTNAGAYTVILTAVGAGGTNAITFTNYIVATNAPVVADFTGAPTIGLAPLAVSFSNGSSGATSYSWDFGDGTTSTAASPAKTYTNAGTYSVALTAIGAGGTNLFTRTNYIVATNAPPPVIADFTGAPTNGLAPLAVVFTNLSSGAASYAWDFGDGNTSTQANPTNVYTNVGSYTVILTAVGAGGTNVYAVTDYIVATNAPVVADFTGAPTVGLAPLAVSFSNGSSGAASYSWDFGDGTTSTAASPAKTYTNAGTYSVTLMAVGAGGTNLFTRTNYIVATNAPPPVIADFTGAPTNGLAPLAVVFTNLSSGAASYAWDFGDGNTSTDTNPTNVYTNAGSYTVILTAVGAGGANAITFTNYIVATNAPVVADFTGAPTIGLAPLAVSFSNLSSGAASYNWDFGDGTTSTAASPAKTYTNAGTYSVTLMAVGAGGTNLFTRTNYIVATNAPPPVIANFTGAPTNGLAPLAVVFTNLSSGAASYAWDFGDGNTSTDTNPTNTYLTAGAYTVTLVAVGPGGTNVYTQPAYVTVTNPPVVANFTGSPTAGLVPLLVVFTNLSSGATNYAWDFGDGNTSAKANASNTFVMAGTYSVTLTATGPGGGDTLTLTNYIVVTNVPPPPVIADFVASATMGEAPLKVVFTNLSSGATGYTWDFGDGNNSAAVNPSNTYTNAGTYTVTLTAVGAGGVSVLTKTNYLVVTNAPPPPVIASFTGAPASGLAPLSVAFSNTSSGATDYIWDFGDGNSSGSENPSNTFTSAGTYSVTLTAIGPGGTNIVTLPNYIVVTNMPAPPVPVPSFVASPTNGEPPLVVTFSNLSTGATNYLWDFGDGNTSTAANPVYTYNNAGVFNVTLTAIGPGGTNTVTCPNYITTVAGAFIQSGGIVTMEAEHYWKTTTAANHSWIPMTDVAGYVGSAAMKSSPNSANTAATIANSPMLAYSVLLTNSGPATLWIRGWAASGSDDSVYAGIDGTGTNMPYSQSGAWMWKSLPITVPSSGAHTVNIWMREDGAYVDRVILSLNASFTPTGNGPAESVQSSVPVSAQFTAFPTSGVAPQLVVFTNSSIGATNYLWSFGDGGTSEASSPTHNYITAGTYTVTLQAVGAGGTDTLIRTNYIVVAVPPPPVVAANFTAQPESGLAPLAVTFTNLSGGATAYLWNFGDGSTSTDANPFKVFANAGNYSVTLTATGPGGINILTRTNFIVVTNLPAAPFSVQIAYPTMDSTFPEGNVPITATVANPGGSIAGVGFYANGLLIASDTADPYTFNWSATSGMYQLSAVALNSSGIYVTSAPVNVSITSTTNATLRWSGTSQRIYVTGPGTATLTQIKTALAKSGVPLTLVDSNNAVWYLGANLFVQNGAQLKLYGPEIGGDVSELRLKSDNTSDANAIVEVRADWGWIDIRNTKVTSWDSAATGPDLETDNYGRAYIRARSSLDPDGVTARESRLDVINSEICYLGSHDAEAYGLVWKVVDTSAVYIPAGSTNTLFDLVNVYGDILNSHLHHNFFGMYTYGQYGGHFANNEVDHNLAYGFDPHDDSDYLVIENNNVHHNGWHGIIASKRCDHGVIRNNVSWNNGLDLVHPHGNGIMLHRSCNYWVVENNLSFGNPDAGIALFAVNYNVVRNNTCYSNASAGLRLSVGASANWIENNEFGFNQQYGFYLYQGSDTPDPDDSGEIGSGRCVGNIFTNNYVHDYISDAIHSSASDANYYVNNMFVGSGTVFRLETGTNNVMDGNVVPANALVKVVGAATNYSSAIIQNQPSIRVQVDAFSTAYFADAYGAVFDFSPYAIATVADANGSLTGVTMAQIGAGVATVQTRAFYAIPGFGNLTVLPTTWETSGNYTKAWYAQASSAAMPVTYFVGDLQPGQTYDVYRNSVWQMNVTADVGGYAGFATVAGSTATVSYVLTPAGP